MGEGMSACDVMANILDYNITVIDFKFQSLYYFFNWEKYEDSYLPAKGYIVTHLFLYKDGFGIKYPMKVDIPLNQELKPINDDVTVCLVFFWCLSFFIYIIYLIIISSNYS